MQRDSLTTRGHLGLAAERRRAAHLNALRAVAVAEGDLRRARMRMMDVVAEAETALAVARHAAGLSEAA